MIVYVFYCNAIVVDPMKSCSVTEWITAYEGIDQELTTHGFNPQLQNMNNEASMSLKKRYAKWSHHTHP
jgi:hypothetical protein